MSKEKTTELLNKLEQGVSDMFSSNRFKEYLNFVAKFHRYSYFNTLLILMQKNNASMVAGFKKWNEMGRFVKKGEKGIAILAPSFTKVPLKEEKGKQTLDDKGKPVIGEGEKRLNYFLSVYVFDISQTDGEPLPQIVHDYSGDVNNYDELYDALSQISPYPIQICKLNNGTKGECSYSTRKILLSEDLSQAQTLKTLIHEIAHAKLHIVHSIEGGDRATNIHRTDAEIEAESVAYVVCQHLNIDTSDYSFGYIANWSKGKDTNQLKAALQTISKESDKIITELDQYFSRDHEVARNISDR